MYDAVFFFIYINIIIFRFFLLENRVAVLDSSYN